MSTPRLREALLVLLLTAAAAQAPAVDDDAAQRERIARERADVVARARAGEAACADRFAVSACLSRVRSERRAALQLLDRQSALLDDARRRQRAAERQQRIQAREQGAASAAASAPPPDGTRPPRGVAERPLAPSSPEHDGTAADRVREASSGKEDARAARRAAATQRSAEQARAHREAVERRNQERAASRPLASPLPVPPAAAASR